MLAFLPAHKCSFWIVFFANALGLPSINRSMDEQLSTDTRPRAHTHSSLCMDALFELHSPTRAWMSRAAQHGHKTFRAHAKQQLRSVLLTNIGRHSTKVQHVFEGVLCQQASSDAHGGGQRRRAHSLRWRTWS
eukprot:scaffold7551_cov19-Tisochrysis_lutea.AAC.3